MSEEVSLISADINEIVLGMTASCSQLITDAGVVIFSGISGDKNPVHLSDDYARQSRYKRRIAHGMLSASLFSGIFGTKLPGTGCVYVSQTLSFLKPVYIGDTVAATVTVTAIDLKTRRVKFLTDCKVRKKTVIKGEAVIYIPEDNAGKVKQCDCSRFSVEK